MILTARPATTDEAIEFASRLRPEDEREIRTASGQPPTLVVPMSLAHSDECYTFRLTTPEGSVADKPSVFFGVSRDPSGEGRVWMLCAKDVVRAPLSILREGHRWIEHWQQKYTVLHNVADERNDLHLRWIQLLGFKLGSSIDVKGFPFRYFYKVGTA